MDNDGIETSQVMILVVAVVRLLASLEPKSAEWAKTQERSKSGAESFGMPWRMEKEKRWTAIASAWPAPRKEFRATCLDQVVDDENNTKNTNM